MLKIDFRKYFDNIRHDVLLERIGGYFPADGAVMRTLKEILKANEVDISYAGKDITDEVFNGIEYQKIPREKLTGERFMRKSIGIGAPIAQISGIFLPTQIDTYCKTVKGLHCYDAYMDDRIIIHPDKDYLKNLLDEIRGIAGTLGIHINEKKTQIIKLSHGFTFLKTRYILTATGKIIRKIPHDVVTRERRKLKKLAQFVKRGDMTAEAFEQQYKSWRGDKSKYHAKRTLNNMDNLFRGLMTWITRK